MLKVMAALLNRGGALCSTPQSFADARYTRVPCSNAANTRNPLKFAGVPKTCQQWAEVHHVVRLWRRYCCLTVFSNCRYVTYLRRYSPTKLCDVAQKANFWRFLGPAFPASHVQHISDMHSKFALRPRHV